MKEELIKKIREMENPYPKDIFLWENKEKSQLSIGRFNKFIFEVVENTKEDIIKLIGEKDEE